MCELWESRFGPARIVPTVRQFFYCLAVEELVEKSDKGYSTVQRALARARERGDFPWDGVRDNLRELRTVSTWQDLPEYLGTARSAYRLDKWALQPRRVEVWIEKDTLAAAVEPIAREYEVPLLVDRGYLSVSAKKEASRRIDGRPFVIIYVGDLDPSGVNMAEEAEAWVRAAAGAGTELELDRIAVVEADLSNPAVPRLPVNGNDSRTKDYLRRFGNEVIEVEALAPEELQERVRRAIERHRDAEAWDQAVARESDERADLRRRLAE
ncbi:MAG: hypothetical protein K8T20_12010 [Planctomycetes bacterium]|nr:hypothetical protein [Planctomycetota bacterium]